MLVRSDKNNKNISCVCHKFNVVDENNEPFDVNTAMYLDYKEDYIYTKEDLKKRQYPGQTATQVFRNFFKDMTPEDKALYKSIRCNGDIKTYVPMLKMGDIYCIDEVMSSYRVTYTGDSWTARNIGKNLCLRYFNSNCDLKKYAREVLNIDINRKKQQDGIVCKAFIIYLTNRTEENRRIFLELFKRSSKKPVLVFKIFGTTATKLIKKIFKR